MSVQPSCRACGSALTVSRSGAEGWCPRCRAWTPMHEVKCSGCGTLLGLTSGRGATGWCARCRDPERRPVVLLDEQAVRRMKPRAWQRLDRELRRPLFDDDPRFAGEDAE